MITYNKLFKDIANSKDIMKTIYSFTAVRYKYKDNTAHKNSQKHFFQRLNDNEFSKLVDVYGVYIITRKNENEQQIIYIGEGNIGNRLKSNSILKSEDIIYYVKIEDCNNLDDKKNLKMYKYKLRSIEQLLYVKVESHVNDCLYTLDNRLYKNKMLKECGKKRINKR